MRRLFAAITLASLLLVPGLLLAPVASADHCNRYLQSMPRKGCQVTEPEYHEIVGVLPVVNGLAAKVRDYAFALGYWGLAVVAYAQCRASGQQLPPCPWPGEPPAPALP